MADDVPRYLGTTAAEAVAALRKAMGSDLFLRAYDIDGDDDVTPGSEDEVALVEGVCAAEREVDENLAASHGAPFTGVVPPSVRDIVRLLAPWETVQWRLKIASDEKLSAPFKGPHAQALKRLERLAADKNARIPEKGAPAPANALPIVYSERSFWGGGCGDGGGSRGGF